MKILLCGPSGVGKGKASEFLFQKYSLPSIATGDLVRAEIAKQSEVGKLIEGIVKEGGFIPNDVAMNLLKTASAGLKNYVLDGYPRTLSQAKEFATVHQESEVGDFVMIWLHTSRDILKKRMFGRGRSDDNEAVIERRLDNYERETIPCIEYLATIYPLFKFEASGTVEEVNEKLAELMNEISISHPILS